MTPQKALAAYILTIIVFILGVFSLYNNLEPQLTETSEAIEHGTTIVLKKGLDQKKLSDRLYNGGYINDRNDADLISSRIKRFLDNDGILPNLGALLKFDLKISADTALLMGGNEFKTRVEIDYSKLGISKESTEAAAGPVFSMPNADAVIRAKISNGKGSSGSVANIPVRIKQYSYKNSYRYSDKKDSQGNVIKTDSILVEKELTDSILGFARTNANGIATFNVKKGSHYSIIPIQQGFQYGREKGTTNGALSSDLDLSFVQKPHVLTLFSSQVFSNIKYDKTLIIRTPEEFISSLIMMTIAFIFGWLIFLIFTFRLDKKRNTRSDYLLIIALMIISGIGLLTSYSIWNPLTDTLYGSVMTSGLIIGLIAMAGLSFINYAKLDARFSASKWSLLRNYGWVALGGAIGLLAMLYLFGSGPEGSDAKVNLFGFQPSEMARVLIIIFIAWFFARNANLIQDFSQRLTKKTAKRQLSVVSGVILAIVLLMGIYLKLSDMGPALVVLVSFILIYSMARRDFAQLLLGLFTYLALIIGCSLLSKHWQILLTISLIWLVAWVGYWYWKKKQLYESAIFLNLVIFIFIAAGGILESVGLDNLANRFNNRNDMAWGGVWNNEVLGGDQVVQGIWSLATGGLTGLGLGNGSPAIVPAGHTDMIFTTIGEMLGLVGLILVVLCFFVIIHRTLLIGRRAGYAFPFYLATGLGIVTGIQFLVIVAGSIGLLPLTGVTLPFLSYGRISFIISLASFGFVISISRLRANKIQQEYTRSFNGSIVACSGLFLLIGVLIIGTAAKYQILSRGATLIRPALVTNMDGARIIEYNPRIALVLRKLDAGNIFDRNGLLLATSSKEELEKAKDALLNAGVTAAMYDSENNKRKRRYYPFENHTLFMLGDYNTLKVFGYTENNPIGYLAEARHINELRGIDIPSQKVEKPSKKFKQNRFMDESEETFSLREYDYSNLLKAGFLDYGIERNPVIEKHNASRAKRDLTLTLDARLQTLLQNALSSAVSKDPSLNSNGLLRASVVVLDAKNGDLLTSANYPLPNQDSIFMLNDKKIYGAVPFEKIKGHAPITERDLGLTFQTQPGSTAKVMSAMAAFMNLGAAAANITYDINIEEIIDKSNGVAKEPIGPAVTMQQSIVESSNCYFINLIHDKKLYTELDSIYYNAGIRVNPDSVYAKGNIVPYFFTLDEVTKKNEFNALLESLSTKATTRYMQYLQERSQGKYRTMNFGETQAAWGQGPILASPLNMARISSIVANDGKFTPTRYILKEGEKSLESYPSKQIISTESARILKSYMQQESDKHRRSGKALPLAAENNRIGGKTGTPERVLPQRMWRNNRVPLKSNDAWYVFFIHSGAQNTPLAVALRLERTGLGAGNGSGKAVQIVADVVIPVLNEAGYKVM